jgi:hypothetical protein
MRAGGLEVMGEMDGFWSIEGYCREEWGEGQM